MYSEWPNKANSLLSHPNWTLIQDSNIITTEINPNYLESNSSSISTSFWHVRALYPILPQILQYRGPIGVLFGRPLPIRISSTSYSYTSFSIIISIASYILNGPPTLIRLFLALRRLLRASFANSNSFIRTFNNTTSYITYIVPFIIYSSPLIIIIGELFWCYIIRFLINTDY